VGVTYEQVIAVNRKIIEEVSPQLWDYAKGIIDDSLAKGYLKNSY